MEQSVEAMSAIPGRMNEAWNRGDATAFFADFAEDADFVEFEGTVHKGRESLVAVHQPIFDTVLKGSRLVRGEVLFTRVLHQGSGVVHHRVGILMPGEEEPLPSRYCMQLYVVVWQNDRWEVVALQNSRIVSLAAALTLDASAVAQNEL